MYVEILECGLNNETNPYSANEWEKFVGELDFDEITEIAAHAKLWKVISVEHLSKVWSIDL